MKAKIHTSNFECLLTREVALCVCELSLKLENAELLLLGSIQLFAQLLIHLRKITHFF